jgi:hypothetical protein
MSLSTVAFLFFAFVLPKDQLPSMSDFQTCISITSAICERAVSCEVVRQEDVGKCLSVFNSVCDNEDKKEKKHRKANVEGARKMVLDVDCEDLLNKYFK